MTIVGRILERRAWNPDLSRGGVLRSPSDRRSGTSVTADTAMTLMAVWRCQNLLADIVSQLPIHQYRDRDDTRVKITPSEYVRTPSDLVDAEDWRAQLMFSALQRGNAYLFVTQLGTDLRVRKAEVLNPNEVTVRRSGSLAPPRYLVNGTEVDIERIRHLRAFGPMPGSVLGLAPLEYMRDLVELGVNVREMGANWYRDGGQPTFVLQSTEKKLDDTEARQAKNRFREATQGDPLVVLGSGWKYETIGISPDDALFLGAINATAVDVCGFYGVAPEMLGIATSGTSVTYANREQRAIDVLTWTVQWWISRIERLISRDLPNPQYVKINVDALLRTDAATRWKIHDMAVRMGARNIDRVRQLEDELPLPNGEGQRYLWPPSRTFQLPEDIDPTPAA